MTQSHSTEELWSDAKQAVAHSKVAVREAKSQRHFEGAVGEPCGGGEQRPTGLHQNSSTRAQEIPWKKRLKSGEPEGMKDTTRKLSKLYTSSRRLVSMHKANQNLY